MGKTPKFLELLILAVVALLVSEISSSCVPVSIRVKVEFLQQVVASVYKYEKRVESSSYFKVNYNHLSTSGSVSGGYGGFSASASAAYEKVTSSAIATTKNSEFTQEDKVDFGPGVAQIIRKLTSVVTINGITAKEEESIYKQTVPISQLKSDDQLRQDANDYVNRNYGQSNKGEVRDNQFTERSCITEPQWSNWANDNFDGWSNGEQTCDKGHYINWMRWRHQGGYGLIDLIFRCSDGDQRRMTNNNHGDWNKDLSCADGFDATKGHEQGGYEIVNVGVSCINSPHFVDSNGNYNGRAYFEQRCPNGLTIAGFETQEQGGYGIVNFRFYCA